MKFAAALFAAGMSLAASAAENIADYAYQAEIELSGKAAWYRAEIPAAVQWQAAHADLRDLRVFDASGGSIPFALTRQETRHFQERRETTARLFPLYSSETSSGARLPDSQFMRDSGLRLKRDSNGAVEIEIIPAQPPDRVVPTPSGKVLRGWLLDMGAADFAPERLILDWHGEQEGFFPFTIEGSDDLEHWRDWGKGQIVQLNFAGQSIAHHEVRLPQRKASYLRLLWPDARQAAGVRGARLVGAVTGVESAPVVWSQPLTGEVVAEGEGEFVWQFPLSLPLRRLSVVVDETSVLAPIVVSGRDFRPPTAAAEPRETRRRRPLAAEIIRGERRVRDVLRDRPRGRTREKVQENPWRPLASGVIYRLPASTGEQMETELDLPGVPVNQLRLQVDPRGGGLGAQAPVIKLALHARELTFLARGDAPYRLAVGRAEAPAADLPLSTLIPLGSGQAIASGQLGRAHITASAARLESPAALPAARDDQASAPASGKSDTRKIMLWAVLLVGALLLGGMVFSLLRAGKKDAPRDR
jgi:hypothetical protein